MNRNYELSCVSNDLLLYFVKGKTKLNARSIVCPSYRLKKSFYPNRKLHLTLKSIVRGIIGEINQIISLLLIINTFLFLKNIKLKG